MGVLTGLGMDRPGFEWNRHSVVGLLTRAGGWTVRGMNGTGIA